MDTQRFPIKEGNAWHFLHIFMKREATVISISRGKEKRKCKIGGKKSEHFSGKEAEKEPKTADHLPRVASPTSRIPLTALAE